MNEYERLLAEAQAAIDAGDAEKAEELTKKARHLKILADAQASVKAMQDEAEEKARQAEEARAAKEAEELEDKIKSLAEEAVKKAATPARPDYSESEPGAEPPPAPGVPEKLARIAVLSRYDGMSDLDLALNYHIKSRRYKAGVGGHPDEKQFRALMVRAKKFMNADDKVPYIDRYGEVKSMTVPAFDPKTIVPWANVGDEDSMDVPGLGAVKSNGGVTSDGIKQILDIAVKSDELVYSTQSGYGDQWVPTLMNAALWRTIRLQARVLATLPQFDMPSNPFDYPKESTDPTIYGVAETTDEAQLVIGASMPIGDSKIGTAKTTFTAGKIGAITFWSEEMNEDSVIAVEPQFRDQYGEAMAHGIDAVLLHGDETTNSQNISFWGTTLGATSKYLQVDGLRHEAIITTSTDKRDAGALTVDDVAATRVLMGTAGLYGADPSQLVMYCDTATGYKFEMLSEVLTLDKFGPNATILNGMLGKIMGIPIIRSQDYGLTDASGYINDTAGDNTKGQFITVNRMGVKVGWRRRPRIIVGQVPFSDAWYILSLARFDVGFFGAGMVGMSYDITV